MYSKKITTSFCVLKKILLVALILGAYSCRSTDISMLHPKTKIETLLPALTPTFDFESFGIRFPHLITAGGDLSPSFVYGAFAVLANNSRHVADFNIIFQRDIEKNICVSDTYGNKKGTIKCSLIDARGVDKTWWLIPSCCLLFIPNLFGMPCWASEAEMQIEVAIFDDNNNLVGKYRSDVHQHKTYVAAYWGYNDPETRNYLLVFTKCMDEIKRQIANDYHRLYTALQ